MLSKSCFRGHILAPARHTIRKLRLKGLRNSLTKMLWFLFWPNKSPAARNYGSDKIKILRGSYGPLKFLSYCLLSRAIFYRMPCRLSSEKIKAVELEKSVGRVFVWDPYFLGGPWGRPYLAKRGGG